MKDIVREYQENFRHQRKNFRRYVALMLALAMITTLFVNWQLHSTGIAATAQYLCNEEEHQHTADCYEKVLVCGYTEGEPEDWNATMPDDSTAFDESFGVDAADDYDIDLYADEPEYIFVPHEHTDDCYQEVQTLACFEEEHEHTDDCFDPEDGSLICDMFEHTHDDSCYITEYELVCGLEEGELVEELNPDYNPVAMFEEPVAAKPVVIEPVIEAPIHYHTDDCYEEVLVCGLPEHHHTVNCLADPYEDIEDESEWLAKTDTTLDGLWTDDLLTVAKSQLDYEQSEKNFRLDTDDGETVRHYTRYGQWYGNPYGPWDVMFLSYCLNYADIPQSAIPQESGTLSLHSKLRGRSFVGDFSGDMPIEAVMPGDIVIYQTTTTETVAVDDEPLQIMDDSAGADIALLSMMDTAEIEPQTEERTVTTDTVGIVSSVDEASGTLTVISGNVDGKVAEVTLSASQVSTLVSVASAQAEDSGADTMEGDPHDLVGISDDISFVLSKKVNGKWKELGDNAVLTDGDEIKVEIDYTVNSQHDEIKPSKNQVQYQLPKGFKFVLEDGQTAMSGYLSGTVGGEYRPGTEESNWGSFTVDENGLVTIIFNEDFCESEGSFTGTLGIQGKASLEDTTDGGSFKFTSDDKTYTILPKKNSSDLTVEKEGVKNEEDGSITYTVKASTTTGTDGEVRLKDTLAWGGLSNVTHTTPTVKKTDSTGAATDFTYDGSAYTETTEDGKSTFELTLPKLAPNESYEMSYTVKYGDINSKDGAAYVNNGVVAWDDNTQKDSDNANFDIQKKIIEKSGSATDNNQHVQWTITVNPDHQTGLAGTWDLKDKLNDTDIDWSKVDGLAVKKSSRDRTWDWVDASDAFDKDTGKLTLEDGYAYTITYKTPVEYNGSSSVTETNHVDFDKDGKHYEADGTTGVTKSDDFKEKKTAGQTVETLGETVRQKWTVTLNPTRGTSDSITVTDNMYDSSYNVNDSVHWTTKALLTEAFDQLSSIRYELTCYDASGNEVTSDDAKVVSFKLTIIPNSTWSGSAVDITYPTLFSIKDLEEGDTQKVINKAVSGNVEHEADASYTNKKHLHKYVQNQYGAWVEGSQNFDYDTAKNGLKYFITILPENNTEDIVIKDELPEGMIVDPNDVKVSFVNENLWTWTNEWDLEGSNKPAVTLDGQTLTITIKKGFPERIVNSGLGFAIEYTAQLTDEFWNDIKNVSKPYGNTVIWGARHETQTSTVNRTVGDLIKDGEQITDSNGNVTRQIKYWVTINPKGKTLNQGNPLTLKDILKASNLSVSLDTSSAKLYGFDSANADDHFKGGELSDSAFQFLFDEASMTFTVTVPDSTPCVLEYIYTIETMDSTSATLTNTAELIGEGKTTTENNVSVKEGQAWGSVSRNNTLTLIKVDADRYQLHLPGATFRIDQHNGYGDNWTKHIDTVTTGKDGSAEIKFGDYTKNILYRIVETDAPDGYKVSDIPYYFVLLADPGTTADSWWQANQNNLPADDIEEKDITFIGPSGFATLYIPNKSTTLKVQKLWVDSDGNPTDGKPIQVQLYQNTQKQDYHTVTIRWAGNDYQYDYGEAAKMTYQVKPEEPFVVRVKDWWGSDSHYINVNGSEVALSATAWDATVMANVGTYTTGPITEDTTILVKSDWYGTAASNLLICSYSEPEWIAAGSTLYNTVTLGSSNGYSYTWTDLPEADDNDNKFFYTVVEDVPDGYTVSYMNNNGILTGVIVITNKKTPPPTPDDGAYELPSTGGAGTTPYTAVGGAIALAALVCGVCQKRRRERRAH